MTNKPKRKLTQLDLWKRELENLPERFRGTIVEDELKEKIRAAEATKGMTLRDIFMGRPLGD